MCKLHEDYSVTTNILITSKVHSALLKYINNSRKVLRINFSAIQIHWNYIQNSCDNKTKEFRKTQVNTNEQVASLQGLKN